MRLRLLLVAISALLVGLLGCTGPARAVLRAPTPGHAGAATPAAPARPASCPVTRPNGSTPPGEQPSPTHHGNGALWTVLPRDGMARIRAQDVQPDGALGMKFPWWRGTPGYLAVAGRRLDAPAPPLRAEIPAGYFASGFPASELLVPTEGCWEVTGRVGGEGREASLTFVVQVIAPRSCC